MIMQRATLMLLKLGSFGGYF